MQNTDSSQPDEEDGFDPDLPFQIFFCDLNEPAQKCLLRKFRVESPEDMNWDMIPITEIP